MGTKLYVGNLSFSVTETSLQDKFASCGGVQSAKIITDRETGRSKGFGFVEMSSDEDAQKAISSLDGQDFEGRPLRVSEARPQEARPERGPRGGGFGGNRGGPRGGGDRGNRGPRF